MPYTQLFYAPIIAVPQVHNPQGPVNPEPLVINLERRFWVDVDYDSDSSFDSSFTYETASASTCCNSSMGVSRVLEDGSTSQLPQVIEVPSMAEAVMQAKPLVVPLVDIGGCFWVIIAWQKNI